MGCSRGRISRRCSTRCARRSSTGRSAPRKRHGSWWSGCCANWAKTCRSCSPPPPERVRLYGGDVPAVGRGLAMAAKPCLLVVDDEPDLVQSVKDLLRFEYKVLGATRASEGLRIMSGENVQIVMSDQRMPEMTGVEFLSNLKQSHPDTVRL